jgi:virulence-associated protein VagC
MEVYIFRMKAVRAKVFRNGGSQAVRLPKLCRFPEGQREVLVHREGSRVVLEARDEWPADFHSCLGAWSGEVPRPRQPRLADLARRHG